MGLGGIFHTYLGKGHAKGMCIENLSLRVVALSLYEIPPRRLFYHAKIGVDQTSTGLLHGYSRNITLCLLPTAFRLSFASLEV
jgi:hypothetical protein